MIRENIELVGSTEISEDVEKKIRVVGVRGLDFQKARELGLFNRISNILCATHASIMAAYRIYGGASSVMNDFGARKNIIAKAMGDFEKSFMRFVSFWTDYYASGTSGMEVNMESENLYHRIMEWAQLPEQWQLGDEQRTEYDSDIAMRVEVDGKTMYFKRTTVSSEESDCSNESWCVTKYDVNSSVQETVNTDMDKASAMMVAKRLSEEDAQHIYTASVINTIEEKKEVLTPFKAYTGGQTIGKLVGINKV